MRNSKFATHERSSPVGMDESRHTVNSDVNALMTLSVDKSRHGNTYGNREYSSTTVRKYLFWLLLGRGPLKSIEPFKRLRGFDKVAWFKPIKLRFALAANLTSGYNSFDVYNRNKEDYERE